jgi:hypothetical protein
MLPRKDAASSPKRSRVGHGDTERRNCKQGTRQIDSGSGDGGLVEQTSEQASSIAVIPGPLEIMSEDGLVPVAKDRSNRQTASATLPVAASCMTLWEVRGQDATSVAIRAHEAASSLH